MPIILQNEKRYSPVISDDIKSLPTIDTASGSIATFDTDLTENLIEVVCDIQYTQASGTPTPVNPLPITVYTSLNLSHSGADTSNPNITNIPFGQTVAKGKINVTTGVLEFDKGAVTLDGTQPDSDFALSAMTGFTRIAYNPYNNMGVINAAFDSNILEYVSSAYQAGEGKIWSSVTAPRMFLGLPESVTNKSQMQAWFSSNPTQVVFDYADEQIIQLDSKTITALLNENNIWCDTGDTDVKFLLTVGKKIA